MMLTTLFFCFLLKYALNVLIDKDKKKFVKYRLPSFHFIFIFPGDSKDAELLDSVCGDSADHSNDLLPVVSNNSNHVTVVFKTDANIELGGFSIRIAASE